MKRNELAHQVVTGLLGVFLSLRTRAATSAHLKAVKRGYLNQIAFDFYFLEPNNRRPLEMNISGRLNFPS
jgi:hypothetical protein